MNRGAALVLLTAVVVCGPPTALGQIPSVDGDAATSVVACAPEDLIARPGSMLRLRAFAAGPGRRFEWRVPFGTLSDASDATAGWRIPDGSPAVSLPTVTVIARTDRGEEAACSFRVLIPRAEGVLGVRDQRRSLLTPRQREERASGRLYSYVLSPTAPVDQSLAHFESLVLSYLTELATVDRFSEGKPSGITYLFVKQEPSRQLLAQRGADGLKALARFIVQNYDHQRAAAVLARLGDATGRPLRDGPYLVSVLQPLARETAAERPWIIQDLSGVPVEDRSLWLKEFLKQSAQERFWDEDIVRRVVLALRTIVTQLGTAGLNVMEAIRLVRK